MSDSGSSGACKRNSDGAEGTPRRTRLRVEASRHEDGVQHLLETEVSWRVGGRVVHLVTLNELRSLVHPKEEVYTKSEVDALVKKAVDEAIARFLRPSPEAALSVPSSVDSPWGQSPSVDRRRPLDGAIEDSPLPSIEVEVPRAPSSNARPADVSGPRPGAYVALGWSSPSHEAPRASPLDARPCAATARRSYASSPEPCPTPEEEEGEEGEDEVLGNEAAYDGDDEDSDDAGTEFLDDWDCW